MRFSAIPAHIRIRIMLVVAVAVICGGVFVVTEVQRRSDETSFKKYAAIRELRGATMQMALAVDRASIRGPAAAPDVRVAQRAVVRAISEVQPGKGNTESWERRLIVQQATAATALSDLANKALTRSGSALLDSHRVVLFDRFVTASDELLRELAAERRQVRRDAARRPVFLVLGLFIVFGFVHLLLVERPASRERRNRRAQLEFVEAMQVARSEAEAYDVLSHHVERAVDALHVTVLNNNNSADRLEPVTPVAAGTPAALRLEGAAPDSCLAVRLGRTHHRSPGDEPLLSCEICRKSATQTTCVPSLVGGEVIGAVLVDHQRQLRLEQQGIIEQSVAEAAPVISNLRNLSIAELRAATDGLTGLPNQRAVHETVKRAAALAGRTTSPLAIVVFDLDHFKTINDTYGHGKGDEVLAAVGAVAADTLRASDFVGRLGGEEFAAVLPATGRAGGLAAAEKLRAAIANIVVPGVARGITASFGVAIMPDDAGEPVLLLREADRALYAAKSAGRNRVETTDTAPAAGSAELVA